MRLVPRRTSRRAGVLGAIWAVMAVSVALAQDRGIRSTGVLARAPRELNQQLGVIEGAFQAENFTEGFAALSTLQEAVTEGGDYFLDLPAGKSTTHSTLKQRARSLVHQIPNAGVRVCRELFDGPLSARLDEAVQQDDREKLFQVAHSWFPVDPVYRARLLAARLYLDEGDRELAARMLDQPWSPLASDALKTERDALSAAATTQANESTDTQPASPEPPRADSEVEPTPRSDAATLPDQTDWALHRGNPQRNSAATPGPPRAELWTVPLGIQQAARSTIDSDVKQSITAGQPVTSAFSPLAIRDQILYPGPQLLRGLDLTSGATRWTFPPQLATGTDDSNAALGRNDLRQRVWHDAVRGQISSDGMRLYLVDRVAAVSTRRPDSMALRLAALRGARSRPEVRLNRLIALDLAREGSFVWRVGGDLSVDDRTLAGTLFLGPPLPYGGNLYAICEQDRTINLLCLAPQTGRRRWSQPLATLEDDDLTQSPIRRLASATPTYSQGVLVCPTNAGAVVAIDLATRELLWGYNDSAWTASLKSSPRAQRSTFNHDASLLAVDDSLVWMAPDGTLTCLGLFDGQLRWKAKRADLRYLGGVHHGVVLVIGNHRFAGLRLEDGKPAWETSPFVAIPAGGTPDGRGYSDGDSFYLPTTDPEVLQIDYRSGEVRRHATEKRLGSLIACGNSVISATPSTVTRFRQSEDGLPATDPQRQQLEEESDYAALTNERLVQLLGEPLYQTREGASMELMRRGSEPIQELVKGASRLSREVESRVITILVRHLTESDAETALAARTALTELADQGGLAVAVVKHELKERRESAERELRQLGARFSEQGKKVTLIEGAWKGDVDALDHLVWLSHVKSLVLRDPSVDDLFIRRLRSWANLESLNLYRSTVTSEGLRHLSDLPRLRVLLLQGTQVDDSAIPHLLKMKSLTAINLQRTKFTPEGITKLKEAAPQLRVLY